MIKKIFIFLGAIIDSLAAGGIGSLATVPNIPTWSVVFFGLHQPWVAFVIIIALIVSIIMTMCCFHRLAPTAFWLLIPYLAWVSFATYLNVGVAILNGS